MRFILLLLVSFGLLYGAKDNAPPSVPQNVQLVYTDGGTIHVTWDASTDNVGVVGYKVGVNTGQSIEESWYTTAGLGFTQGGMPQSAVWEFWIRAYDARGNISAQSAHVVANPFPSVPTGLAAEQISDIAMQVTYDAATDNNGAPLYQLYKNGQAISSPSSLLTRTIYFAFQPGEVVTFTVRSVDSVGNMSPMSEPVAVVAVEWPPGSNG